MIFTLCGQQGSQKCYPSISHFHYVHPHIFITTFIVYCAIGYYFCLFDDEYVFNADGTFQNILGSETWLETWQGVAEDSCGAPVAPHDGNSEYTWELDMENNMLTINGLGGYLGLPKAVNDGELGNPDNPGTATGSTVYMVEFSDNDTRMIVDIESGTNVWWRFVMEKQ